MSHPRVIRVIVRFIAIQDAQFAFAERRSWQPLGLGDIIKSCSDAK